MDRIDTDRQQLLLYEAAMAGLRETSLPTVVQQVLATLAELVPAWRHSMGVIDPDRGVFVVYEAHGDGASSFGAGRSVPLSMFGGDLERLAQGLPEITEDLHRDPAAAGSLRGSPMRSQLLVPICHSGSLLGTLNLGATQTAAFSATDAEVAGQLAEIVAHVLQRVRLRQELVRAHDDALRASADKEAYLAQASHELRSPINAMLGYIEMLGDEPDELPLGDRRDTLSRIHTSAAHVRRLVDDLLDLARAGSDAMSVQAEPVEVEPLLRELTFTAEPLVARRGNRWSVSCDDGLVVSADRLRLLQALLNLVSNAARFTERGTVALTASLERDRVSISVSDDGVGIEASKLATLFDPFTQAHDPRTGFGGTGLGLAITDRYVRRMGGRIHVQSELGRGTTFTIVLPVAAMETPNRPDRAR